MQKMIDASELQQRFGEVLDEVSRDAVQYVVAGDDGPEVALISYAELARLRQIEQREQRARERWEQMRAEMAALSADYSEEELAADIEVARQEILETQRGRRP